MTRFYKNLGSRKQIIVKINLVQQGNEWPLLARDPSHLTARLGSTRAASRRTHGLALSDASSVWKCFSSLGPTVSTSASLESSPSSFDLPALQACCNALYARNTERTSARSCLQSLEVGLHVLELGLAFASILGLTSVLTSGFASAAKSEERACQECTTLLPSGNCALSVEMSDFMENPI